MNTVSGLSLKNNTSNIQRYNLNVLLNRSKGQQFRVDKAGRLVEIKGLFNDLSYLFFQSRIREEVKQAVSVALTSIDAERTQAPSLRRLFFDKFKSLSEQVFDRSQIPDEIISRLRQKDKQGINSELSARVQEVRFAVSLGVDFQSISEGDCGTYFGRDYKGKRLIVFKPFDEESSSGNSTKIFSRIKGVIFRVFPFLRTHTNIKRECAYLNEIGASKVDSFLGLGMVPDTRLFSFSSARFLEPAQKKGSCQLYVEDTVMLQHKIGLPSFDFSPFLKRVFQKIWLLLFGKEMANPCTSQEMKKWAILDFLVGNQDGHLNNQLFGSSKLILIDYGLAFPSGSPENMLSTVNQYQFAYLNGAEECFRQQDQELIRQLDDPDSLISELGELMKDGDTIGFDQSQAQAMRDRIEILQAVVQQGKSIQYLGEIKYAEDFERARRELGLSPGS